MLNSILFEINQIWSSQGTGAHFKAPVETLVPSNVLYYNYSPNTILSKSQFAEVNWGNAQTAWNSPSILPLDGATIL